MRMWTAARRALGLSLAFALAMPLVTLEILAAEAGPTNVRHRAGASPVTVDRVGEHRNTRARLPIRIRIRSGSGSDSDSAERQDEKARPKSPDAAAAAAARARAALAAEKAAQGRKAATAGGENQPIPLGKTTDYSNGVTCLAGC